MLIYVKYECLITLEELMKKKSKRKWRRNKKKTKYKTDLSVNNQEDKTSEKYKKLKK